MKLSTMVTNNDEYQAPKEEIEQQETSHETTEVNTTETPETDTVETPQINTTENTYERNGLSIEDIQNIAGISHEPNESENNADIMPEAPSEAEQAELDYMKSLSGM